MRTYRCPTCGKALTKSEYEKVLRIHEAREKHYHDQEDLLLRRQREQKAKEAEWKRFQAKRERDFKQQAARKLRDEKDRIRAQERTKAARQTDELRKQLQLTREKLRQRQRGITAQGEGLEFEEKLAARLKKEFPEDQIVLKGKGGDVLQTVRFNRKQVGVIIYECKRTQSILSQHVAQAHRAKQVREADFAVLVTTGKKKGFTGFAQMGGVSVVSPPAVVALAALLRDHLVEMAHLRVTREKRATLAGQLLRYIDSPQFKNPLEEVVQRTSRLEQMIKKEASDHVRTWRDRWSHYQTINWNAAQVQTNVRLVLHGGRAKPVAAHKPAPLQLLPPK